MEDLSETSDGAKRLALFEWEMGAGNPKSGCLSGGSPPGRDCCTVLSGKPSVRSENASGTR